jgi:hypothetical protein
VGQIHTLNEAPIVREVGGLVGALSEDEAALVRTLTPPELAHPVTVEHRFDLVDLVSKVRSDESVADYVYAFAPGWDDTIETLMFGARVTSMVTNIELGRGALVPA